MAEELFFEEATDASRIKAQIVSKYFKSWATIMMLHSQDGRIGYIDLFAGPGRYNDNTKSTPLLVLETAINDPKMQRFLLTRFNDKNINNVAALQSEIKNLPNIQRLTHYPIVSNLEVDEGVVRQIEKLDLMPTLCFLDPWGYKGLSARLISAIMKNWGCECIFFFNYNRINMGINNDIVEHHMVSLFGTNRVVKLRQTLSNLSVQERESTIIEAISETLVGMGSKYVLPFRFRSDLGERISHHLIFASKNPTGYKIMKEIMAKQSDPNEDGFGTFEYNPATKNQPLLFNLTRPIEELGDMLCQEFAGRTLPMSKIYDLHNVGRQYINKNYKNALCELELQGRIVANPPSTSRKKNTFADTVMVTFPKKEG